MTLLHSSTSSFICEMKGWIIRPRNILSGSKTQCLQFSMYRNIFSLLFLFYSIPLGSYNGAGLKTFGKAFTWTAIFQLRSHSCNQVEHLKELIILFISVILVTLKNICLIILLSCTARKTENHSIWFTYCLKS